LQLKPILQQVPDPRGKQGQDYKLWSILSLIILSLLCGRRGMKAAFVLGRGLSRRQKAALGFVRGTSPCHATLTETMRVIDAQALADVLGSLRLEEGASARHIAIDGKTMRASKDREGKAEHVLSAFCCGLQTVLGHEASRGKGLEIPDALNLLERLDLTDKIVTGDAIFCQKSIATKRFTVPDIVGRIGTPPSLVIFTEGNHLMVLLSDDIVGAFPLWATSQPQYADLDLSNIVHADAADRTEGERCREP